jgi:hypothetical protein
MTIETLKIFKENLYNIFFKINSPLNNVAIKFFYLFQEQSIGAMAWLHRQLKGWLY